MSGKVRVESAYERQGGSIVSTTRMIAFLYKDKGTVKTSICVGQNNVISRIILILRDTSRIRVLTG